MLRVRLIAAVAFVVSGVALAGCSSTSMPSWLQVKPPPPPVQALQFQSEPPGADVRTVDGQTCRTPCTLALPVTAQSVSIALNGFLPQNVPLEVQQTTDTPSLSPNPVAVTLQSSAPPPVVKRPKKKPAKTAAKPANAAPASQQDSAFPPPPPPQASSPYPSPPQQQIQSSPFPPPPSQQR